jgi:hypothetical protein
MGINNISKICNSLGLLFDICGAWLVAAEVIKIYKGSQFNPLMFDDIGTPLQKDSEYKKWETKKYNLMKIGLFLLTTGFVLQILSNWLPSLFNLCLSVQTK